MSKTIKDLNIALVGATGAVGLELLKLFANERIPLEKIHCYASANSAGKKLPYQNSFLLVKELEKEIFQEIDLAFFSAGSQISKAYVPLAKEAEAISIDNSSAFRKDPNVPLIVPEVNPEAIHTHQGIISSPNCVVAIMLTALFPLHTEFKMEKIVVSTYQAASGAGKKAMEELQEETRAFLENRPYKRTVMAHPYAFNLFTHNSALLENGYVEEEMKVVHETHKILGDNQINISPTCIRVPVLRTHAESIYVEFEKKITANAAKAILKQAPGITFLENFDSHHFPMPIDAIGKEGVFCGRIREDLFNPKALHLWVVADQLLKGASSNMMQIAHLVYGTGSINPRSSRSLALP